jgi:hypothetical protein
LVVTLLAIDGSSTVLPVCGGATMRPHLAERRQGLVKDENRVGHPVDSGREAARRAR